ncbi:hypothetical protein FSP39_000626 [Pinctada imbricata]|uniref:Uncharacterized protein n=1 Tax=Pinctada imbricata TaxID=66713 RepID=A0AA89C2P3_PINIB|nr:hypothetical protein FSP39_000626 [Pinctada imbricata]
MRWEKDEADFKEHVHKIKRQYAELRQLKENLPKNDIILHMDFPENYSCKTADEIQSAYWNQSQGTYGSRATWNYFEAGHGKGPCDGVGGTVKRMADEAVNSSRASFQDAEEFMAWTKQSSLKAVHFFYVSKEDCDRKAETTKKCRLPPVKGTMTLHACKSDSNLLITAPTSCYCEFCLKDRYCEHWLISTSLPAVDSSTLDASPSPSPTVISPSTSATDASSSTVVSAGECGSISAERDGPVSQTADKDSNEVLAVQYKVNSLSLQCMTKIGMSGR